MRRISLAAVIVFFAWGCRARTGSELRAEDAPAVPGGPGTSQAAPLWTLDDELVNTPESVFYPGGDSLYVANMAGSPGDADGKGWITRIPIDPRTGYPDGKAEKICCNVPLNAPKGMGMTRTGGTTMLWVTDLDRVVGFDPSRPGRAIEIKVNGAISLNDTAADTAGHLFVSDIGGGAIFVIDTKTKTTEVLTKDVPSPNGLYVDGRTLWALQWGQGQLDPADFSTSEPGLLWEIALEPGEDGSVKSGGSTKHELDAAGIDVPAKRNFDGLEKVPGGFLISNFTGNTLERVDTTAGRFKVVSSLPLPGGGGAGDIAVIKNADTQLVFVPRSFGGKRPGLIEAYLF